MRSRIVSIVSVCMTLALPSAAVAQPEAVNRDAIAAALRHLRASDLPATGKMALVTRDSIATTDERALAASIGAELRHGSAIADCGRENGRRSCRFRDLSGALQLESAETRNADTIRVVAWSTVQMASATHSWLYGRQYEVIVRRINGAWKVMSSTLLGQT